MIANAPAGPSPSRERELIGDEECRSTPAFRLHFASPRHPHQAGGIEPVNALELGEMAREGAQVALRSEELGETADLRRMDRSPLEPGIGAKEFGDLMPSFLDLERAGAIDQGAAGRDHPAGGLK